MGTKFLLLRCADLRQTELVFVHQHKFIFFHPSGYCFIILLYRSYFLFMFIRDSFEVFDAHFWMSPFQWRNCWIHFLHEENTVCAPWCLWDRSLGAENSRYQWICMEKGPDSRALCTRSECGAWGPKCNAFMVIAIKTDEMNKSHYAKSLSVPNTQERGCNMEFPPEQDICSIIIWWIL